MKCHQQKCYDNYKPEELFFNESTTIRMYAISQYMCKL